MYRLLLLLLFSSSVASVCSHSQAMQGRSLHQYIEMAKGHSPMISDYRNRAEIEQAELERLRAMHTRSRLELGGDYLFVPVVSTDGGRTAFKCSARSATDYYGYDLGESSGHLHAGVTWTQPLLGGSHYKVAQEQARVNMEMADHRIRMEEHQLERSVTELYLLCLLDKAQMVFTDSVCGVMDRQVEIVRKLLKSGLSKESDLRLLMIEREANAELHAAACQDYHTHLADLHLLCGTREAADVALADTILPMRPAWRREPSLFAEQYRLDSLNAVASLHAFYLQYKPRLWLYASSGLQVGGFSQWHRRFGWSAGVAFSWTIYDGRQKRLKERQAARRQSTIGHYRDNAERQRTMRMEQCLSELGMYDERERALDRQIAEYDAVLRDYGREVDAGQVSVLDFITVLRSKMQTEKERLLLRTNRQLVVAAYNYWNW